MSQGELTLCEHPKLIDGELPLAFYCSDQNIPLLVSTYEFFNFGVFQGSINLEGQLKSVISRLNEYNKLKNEKQSIIEQNKKIESVNKQYLDQLSKVKDDFSKNKRISSFLENIKKDYGNHSLVDSIIGQFCASQFFDEVSLVTLDSFRNKLKTVSSQLDKYREIPDVFLPGTKIESISNSHLSMINQVYIDLWGVNFSRIKIEVEGRCEYVLFLKLNKNNELSIHDLNLIEDELSFLLWKEKYITLKNVKNNNDLLDPFEFCERINFYQSSSINKSLICVDFSNLVQVIDESGERFSWKDFSLDFRKKLFNFNQSQFEICYLDVDRLLFIVDPDKSDVEFNKAKKVTSSFDYWRYFYNIKTIKGVFIDCEVRMYPLSVEAINFRDFPVVKNQIESKKSIKPTIDLRNNQFNEI